MLKRGISIIIAGYPATPLNSARARLCVSAAHNKEDMDRMLRACDEVGDLLCLKFSTGKAGGTEVVGEGDEVVGPPRWTLKDVLEHGVRDAKMQLNPGKASG